MQGPGSDTSVAVTARGKIAGWRAPATAVTVAGAGDSEGERPAGRASRAPAGARCRAPLAGVNEYRDI